MLDNQGDDEHPTWDRAAAEAWIDYGRNLARRDCTACALVPCPRQRWDQTVASVWACACWSESASPPPTERGWRPLDRAASSASQALERLVEMAAFALRIERTLLRALRRLLPHFLDNPGVEYDFFQATSRHLDAAVLSSETAWLARAGFRRLDCETQRVIADLLRSHHADCADIVRARETLILKDCGAPVPQDEVNAAVELVRTACATLLHHVRAKDLDAILRDGFTNWQQAELESFTELTAEEIAVAWRMVQKATGQPDAERPDAIADQDLLWLEAVLNQPPSEPTIWQMHRAGAEFRFDAAPPQAAEDPAARRRRVVVGLPVYNPCLEIVRTTAEGSTTEDMNLERRRSLRTADEDRRIEVRTDRAILTCHAWEPPPWATRFGWDRCGMVADFAVAGVTFGLRWIPPGEFEMGSPEGEPGRWDAEGPQHRVTIGRGFSLGETPVTQGQYAAVTGQRPSRFAHAGDLAPVEQVPWDECRQFCGKLAKMVPAFDPRWTFRLPSEAEWEYACRAGTTTALYNGKELTREQGRCPHLDELAWYDANSGSTTHPVGEKQPNNWGLYDMLGNVWEWCQDVWHGSYDGAPEDGSAWAGEGRYRVRRGGGWLGGAGGCRCAYRYYWDPVVRDAYLGFRLVLAPTVMEDAGPFS